MTEVVMIVGGYIDVAGGAEVQAQKLSEMLAKKVNVKVLTNYQRKGRNALYYNGVTIRRYGKYLFGNAKKINYFLGIIIYLILHTKGIKTIHVHGIKYPAVATIFASIIIKKPVICKLVNSGDRNDLLMLRRIPILGHHLCEFVKLRTTIFIAINNEIKLELLRQNIPLEKIRLIPNGVMLPNFSNKKVLKCNDHLRLICVARLEIQKNLDFLLHVVARGAGDIKLEIYGSGSLENELVKKIHQLGLEEHVQLCGTVTRETLLDALLDNDVFVLTSKTEGLSNALLEAIGSGLPVLVSDIPGNRQVLNGIHDDFCLLPFDKRLWIERLLLLKRNPKLYADLSSALLQRAKSFEIGQIADEYISIYRELG